MDFLQIASIFPKQKEKLAWSEANSLWAITRNKLVGLSTLEVYLSQAVDKELKLLLEMGIYKVAVPHIEKTIKLLHNEGLEIPSMPGRTSLEKTGKNTGDINFLTDNEIAVSLREILRLALFLSLRGIENAFRSDVLDLFWQIFKDDFEGNKQTVGLQKRKNWMMQPPGVSTKDIGDKERMTWGEASGLFSIANDKLIKLTLLEIHLSQVNDPDLKEVLQAGVKVVISQLKKITGVMHKEGLEIPSIPGRTSYDTIGRDTGKLNWLKDREIAVMVWEQLRLAILVDYTAIIDTVRSDLLDFVWDILSEDFQRYKQTLELQKRKNWLLSPPSVQPEYK